MKLFYSQQGEDFFIFRNYINQPRSDGTFVELGACDGVLYSNTKFFEDTLQFRGILIEPVAYMAHKCRTTRKSPVFNYAISKEKATVQMLQNSAVSGVVENMSQKFINQWHSDRRPVTVQALPMKDIVTKERLPYIDLISIDVEGSELNVLETMDWDIPIYVICIELDNTYNPEKDEKCREILRAKGFRFDARMCINEFWINDNYHRKNELYKENTDTFTGNLDDYGRHSYLAKHCTQEIVDAIKEKESRSI